MPILDWLGKADALKESQKVPFRLLQPVPELSAGDPDTQNLLIQGDNLEALNALLPFYAGRVRCIFIDPPYNTGSAFKQYDDNLEHATWLDLMYPRLELLREFLHEEGSIWVSIDDNEAHYLKVIGDEVFGRSNFIANIIWQKAYGPRSNAHLVSDSHDHILVFGKNKSRTRFGLLNRSDEQTAKYKNPDNDPRGPWKPENSSISLLSGQRGKQYAKTGESENIFEIESPSGIKHLPPKNRCWAFTPTRYKSLVAEGKIVFGTDGAGRPSVKRFLSEVSTGVLPQSVWTHVEVGHNQDSSREVRDLFPSDPFSTPKPEKLLKRILDIATNEGDLVFDSFLGSGTTAAVAHKMGRHYIGIEMGPHAVTHCAPRLRKVIEGEQGGISESVGWKGGGGFQFMRLGERLFEPSGLINPSVTFGQLASFIWFRETHTPLVGRPTTPLLGNYEGTAIYLLFNGILGDKRPAGGNVLTSKVLESLPSYSGPRVIFGDANRLGADRLRARGITFKQIPYDLKAW